MKLEEFLTAQAQAGIELTCTLEQIGEQTDKVRITPRLGNDCQCDKSFTIRRSDIADIKPLKQQVLCCGKILQLARVALNRGTPVPVEDVLGILRSRPPGDGDGDCGCNGYYDQCIQRGGSVAKCQALLEACMAACGG